MQVRQEWKGQASISNGFMDVGGAQVGQYAVLGDDLAGKTVLIVGYGSIGAAIEARLRPFEVKKIVRVARSARKDPEVFAVGELRSLLPEADIVVAIVPLTAWRDGLFGTVKIAVMKAGELLENSAGGRVVVRAGLGGALPQDWRQSHAAFAAQ